MKRLGALAALACGATYVFGFAVMATALSGTGYGTRAADPGAIVAFLAAHHGLMSVWTLAIYVVNGLALAALAIALGEVLHPGAPGLAPLVRGFGLLWATLVVAAGLVGNVALAEVVRLQATAPEDAARLWHILHIVETGLGGGNEIAGGVWAVLVAGAARAARLLPGPLPWFGAVVGLSGLLTLLPALSDGAGVVFGLGYIVWFFWLAAALSRKAARGR